MKEHQKAINNANCVRVRKNNASGDAQLSENPI